MNLTFLASFLRENGVRVRLLDFETTRYSESTLLDYLRQAEPDVVGVSCMTPSIVNGAQVCAVVKQFSDRIATVTGGPHVNGVGASVLEEFPSFDFAIFGEGEQTLLDLCRHVVDGGNPNDIPGLMHRSGGGVTQNSPRPNIEPLDSLPFPARDLIDWTRQTGHAVRGITNETHSTELFTSRGCPYPCKFCSIQATFGKSARFFSPEYIEQEIREFMRDYQFEHVVVADDTFSLNIPRAKELCEVFQRSGLPTWNCDTRVGTVRPDLLKLMKESGCNKIAYGVETGSERIAALISKKISFERLERAVRWTREAGIENIEGNFIIGVHPDETMDDIEKTRNAITSLPWDFVSVSIIVPYPGTEIHEMMKAQGLIHSDCSWDDLVMFGRRPKWNTNHFSADDLVAIQKKLTREFFLRPSYILNRLRRIHSWKELKYWISSGVAYMRWYLRGEVTSSPSTGSTDQFSMVDSNGIGPMYDSDDFVNPGTVSSNGHLDSTKDHAVSVTIGRQ